MKLEDFKKIVKFEGHTRESVLYLIGGIVVGVLFLLLVAKILSGPFKEGMRKVCTYVLSDDEKAGKGDRKIPVEAVKVKLGTMSKRVRTIGRLQASESVNIKAETAGRIDDILFEEGTSVEKDAVMIQINDADLQAELKEREAQLLLKEADFKRQSSLQGKNFASIQKFDEARASLESAKAGVESVKAKLQKTKICAPFSGTIGLIDVSKGAYVQAGTELVDLVNEKPMKVRFKVPAKFVNEIGAGQVADVEVDHIKNETFRFVVDAVNAKVEEQSVSVEMSASNSNEDGRLKAGLFVHVSLIIGEKGNAIHIPESALEREGNVEFVWVVEKGKAVQRPVISESREKGMVEIAAGLTPGMTVIMAGQLRLFAGAPVDVKFSNPADAAAEEKIKKAAAEKAEAAKDSAEKSSPGKVAEKVPAPKEAAAEGAKGGEKDDDDDS